MRELCLIAIIVGLLVVSLSTIGCGSDEPRRDTVRGKVTYEGKPVVHGTLTLHPDHAKGNKGAFGVAEIKNGVYETNPDYGVTLGPLLVTFTIFDGMPPNNKMIANIRDYPVDISSSAPETNFNLSAKDVKEFKP
jgi:hypothetical protein